MHISITPQIQNYNYNQKSQKPELNSPAKSNSLLSVPRVSPAYYSPSFTSINSQWHDDGVSITSNELEGLKEELKNLSQEETFDRLNISYEKNNKGHYIISSFTNPFFIKDGSTTIDVSMEKLDIDADKLLNNVVEIKGDADFHSLKLSPFKTLKRVGGNLIISFADIESLGSLEEVGASVIAHGSTVKDLGNLEKVGEALDVPYTKNLKSLGKLKDAKIVSVASSNVSDLCSLEKCDYFLGVKSPIPDEQKERIIRMAKSSSFEQDKDYLNDEGLKNLKDKLKGLDKRDQFNELRIGYGVNNDGLIQISNFDSKYYDVNGNKISFSELGLNPNELLDGVEVVVGDVDIRQMKLEPFKTLKYIYGNLLGTCLEIDNLGSLEKVEGSMILDGATINSLGNLKECDDIVLSMSKGLKSLAPLEKAKNISIHYSEISDVSSVKECEFFDGYGCEIPEEQKEYIRSIVTDFAGFEEEELQKYYDKKFNNPD